MWLSWVIYPSKWHQKLQNKKFLQLCFFSKWSFWCKENNECFYFKTLLATFSFSVSHSVMLEQWVFNILLNVIVNTGFLKRRGSSTVCDILCRVIWSTLDTHTPTETKSTYRVHLPFSEVLSSSTTYCFRTRKQRGGRNCISYKERAAGYGGILWNPLESQALMGLILLSIQQGQLSTTHKLQHKSPFCLNPYLCLSMVEKCFLKTQWSQNWGFVTFSPCYIPSIKV